MHMNHFFGNKSAKNMKIIIHEEQALIFVPSKDQIGPQKVFTDCIKNIRILHECQVLIEKSVPRVTVRHHQAPSFSCTPMGADA